MQLDKVTHYREFSRKKLKGPLSDLFVVGILLDAEDLVVVLPLGLAQLQLGLLQQLPIQINGGIKRFLKIKIN